MKTERGTDPSPSAHSKIPPYPLLAEVEARRRQQPRSELRCLGCGHGAVSAELIRCPMCGEEAWDFVEWRPFRR